MYKYELKFQLADGTVFHNGQGNYPDNIQELNAYDSQKNKNYFLITDPGKAIMNAENRAKREMPSQLSPIITPLVLHNQRSAAEVKLPIRIIQALFA